MQRYLDYKQIWSDVKEYGVDLRDTQGVIQSERNAFDQFNFDFTYDWAVTRSSESAELTKIEEAKNNRIKILRQLIKPEIERTQEGYHIGRPDYGFLNKEIKVEEKRNVFRFGMNQKLSLLKDFTN